MADLFNDHDRAYDDMAQLQAAAKDRDAQIARDAVQADPSMQPQQMEADVASGAKAGPTLEPSETEKIYAEYQDDPNIDVIDGKPFKKPLDLNAADVAAGYTGLAVDRMAAVGRGTADTAINAAAALVPWLKPVDAAYDKTFGVETESDPATRTIRQISQNLVPTLVIGGMGANAIQGAAAKSVMLGSRQNLIGRISFEAGVSSVVTAITDDTYTNDFNTGNLLSDLFGVDVPWMHIDGDSPYWTYAKNMVDDAFFSLAGGALEAFTALRSTTKHIPKNEVSSAYLSQKIAPLSEAAEELQDKVSAAVKVKDDARAQEVMRETAERIQRDADNPNPSYDAFKNEPHFPSERAVKNYNADVVDFKTDLARIAKDGDEYGTRARPAVTEGMKKFIGQGDEFREQALKDFGELLEEINVDTQIGGDILTEEFKMEAVDELLDKVANLDGKDLAKSLKSMRKSVTEIRGMMVKSIGPDKSQIAQAALDRMMDLFDQRTRRASAVVAYQAGKDMADSATSINLAKGSNWTARQQEQLIQNIPVLMQEIRAQKFLSGYQLQMERMTKDAIKTGEFNAQWVNNKNEEFLVELANTRQKSLELVNTLMDISQENPDYFAPLYQQIARTNGEVDSIEALNKLMSKRMGFWKKAFIDGEKEVPSLLVQEMQSMRYNSVLFGMAPVNAGYDAFQTTVLKPLVTLAGIPGSNTKFADLKKSIHVFGGVFETMRRAMKHAADEWRFALMHPDFAHARGGRADLDLNNTGLKDYDTMELMMKAWENDKTLQNRGKLMVGSLIQRLAAWNRVSYEGDGAGTLAKNMLLTPRAGVNALSFVDGYTKSMMASFVSRSKAYDEIFKVNNGVVSRDLFKEAEKRIYASMFDKDGLLINPEATYLSKEANLNLDNDIVSGVESFTKNFPIVRSLFMFPRTGANYVARVATYLPTSPLGLAIGKSRKVLYAKTPFEKAEALKAHGIDPNDMEAFKRLKQDYIGRQNMGAMIVTSAGLAAYTGVLTGKGPTDHNERRRWQEIRGWQPMSIRIGTTPEGNPIWWSYEGTQFESLLGLISDIVFHRNKVDEDASDWFNTLSGAVSLNVTNKTFLSGFEPLVAALNGDESSMNRFIAREMNSFAPASGLRNALSRGLDENLNDVKNHWTAHLAHMNRFIPIVGDGLQDEIDIYTGRPIGHESPLIMDILKMLPFGRISSDMEPWRMRLLESGWDNKPSLLRDAETGLEYTPEQRQTMNWFVGTQTSLGKDVEELMMRPDGWYKKQIEEYKKTKPGLMKRLTGQGGSNVNYNWKKSFLYDRLTKMHNDAFYAARQYLIAEDRDLGQAITLQKITNQRLGVGDFGGASESRDQLLQFNSTK